MAKRGKPGQEEKNSPSGLSPFRDSLYRALWFAVLFSYIGSAMYEVGASWLMTSLAPNPLFVSLITTASTLPIFLFALPSGALSDIFDRQNILLIACGYMFSISIILGILTLLGITTPSLLLILTFALGAGTTMIRTPIIPAMSSLVSRSELPAALTLSAVASNIGRAVGPTVGGFVVTAIAPWAVFFLNSASFIVMIVVLLRLPRKSNVQSSQPPENIIGAIRAQIRYIRNSQAAHVLIVRSILFTLCSSALLSLLPLLAKHELRLDSTGFGLLLGSFGTGAVIGGIAILPKLSPRFSVESFLTGSIGLLAAVIFTMGYVRDFSILCIVMGIGGIAYITILSKLYTIGMKSAPNWIGSRVLAVYLLVLNGGLVVGSVIWGTTATILGIPLTLSIDSIALGATIVARKYYSTTLVSDLDFTPASSDHWSLPPHLLVEPAQSDDQTLITIEYRIDPKLSDEFEQSTRELGRTLKSEGMAYWELFQDPADFGHYLEIRIADTWTDHMRHHERVTKNVQNMENRIRTLLKDGPQPIVSHYIAKSAPN
ncbi:MAG: MFS transporter [Thermoproteota archaeon]|nr:MFS transporter [Thermoproteota archaeon]